MQIVSAQTGHSKSQFRHESSICIFGNVPEILTRIYDTHIKLCIYKRAISANVKKYAIFLQNTFHDFQLTQSVPLHQLNDLLIEALPQHRYRHYFLADVYTVSEMYTCLFGLQRRIRFRLRVLNKTMCPRFHTDNVPCRLITTYTGKGTEWLDRMASNRELLKTFNEKPVSADSIQRLDSGDIALLKGDKWEGSEGSGVIHRSPDLEANEVRLLLSLDVIRQQ